MGIDPTFMAPEGWHAALAALEWQMDLGVTEITGEDPVDRYALPDSLKAAAVVPAVKSVQQVAPTDPVTVAQSVAAQAGTLADLRDALNSFDLCDLKRGARSTVFADGNPAARVLVLGDPPGRDDEADGRPFTGRAGHLFDRMFAAIGLSRASTDPRTALYLTNALPWRTPQNRDPEPEEIAVMRPFVLRHIELVNPAIIIAMGNAPCLCLLGTSGVLRLRGTWAQALQRPVLPMAHPTYLLRNPAAKREAWADLLSLKARLR